MHLQDMSQHAAHSATLGQQQLQQEQQQAAAVAQEQQPCVPFPGHQPDSAQVRMESQLIFDSCWRRFKEKHGMVSNNSIEQSQPQGASCTMFRTVQACSWSTAKQGVAGSHGLLCMYIAEVS
jgi:hypothetical protein